MNLTEEIIKNSTRFVQLSNQLRVCCFKGVTKANDKQVASRIIISYKLKSPLGLLLGGFLFFWGTTVIPPRSSQFLKGEWVFLTSWSNVIHLQWILSFFLIRSKTRSNQLTVRYEGSSHSFTEVFRIVLIVAFISTG